MTTEYQRIEILKKDLGLSFAKISIKPGPNIPQFFYDIKSGKCGVSKDLAKKFQDIFFINAAWLLTGEGEMYMNGGEKES